MRTLLAFIISTLILGAVPSAAETLNPHFSKTLCLECHVDEENYALRSQDQIAFCNRCHEKGEHVGSHHLLQMVGDGTSIPAGWPLLDNRLTCFTCHLPCPEKHRDIEIFLRGGSYKDAALFCGKCHDTEAIKSRNPHEEVNRGEGCLFCHATAPVAGVDTLATVTFWAHPNTLCLRCHDGVPHPANFVHIGALEARLIAALGYEVTLYRGNTIICSTCHNPHILESDNDKLRGVVTNTESCPGCHDQ